MIWYILLCVFFACIIAIAVNFALKCRELDEDYDKAIAEIYSRKRKK